ncbi:DUF805 domain-containing protein [Psychrobacter sanguinis]|uniref:DUF805 domain-containing protein n=1 Tax=Psychrobacter sanguinis TaxID=861445 RepID=UPI00020C98D3|nr:DUF805 domain-containing protein [Psychrobacter sanguinis]EGK09241.1 inner membrane protein YhaH [Psychrobacter sp. 1501(2011)]HBH33786.1 DUF805 domain-containing protein [Psychrobacter sp.]MCC3307021.1 DUF805 domain-containing protein [Psychrobacter sanguinis]MCD9152311.1 DUF805 domain-containing protein [Psychrobacter sanguinis]MDY3306426.1 DUF805 domain-containing protein [Psychrobacter sanguinis]
MTQSFSPNDPTLNRSNEVLWQVEENYTAFDWFKKVIKNTFNYKGRARRKEYWYYILVASIIILIGFTLDGILDTPDTLSGLAGFILFFPSLAVTIRRLHDIGKSGWWYLISAIPLIGSLILLFWNCQETSPETNQWGVPAKRVH